MDFSSGCRLRRRYQFSPSSTASTSAAVPPSARRSRKRLASASWVWSASVTSVPAAWPARSFTGMLLTV